MIVPEYEEELMIMLDHAEDDLPADELRIVLETLQENVRERLEALDEKE